MQFETNVAFFNTNIGIVHCVPDIFKFTETSYRNFPTGSHLSYQLQVNESFELITNIKKLQAISFNVPNILTPLPLSFYSKNHCFVPHNWELNKKQKDVLLPIKVYSAQSRKYEADKITQTENPLWFNLRKHRLTSSLIKFP